LTCLAYPTNQVQHILPVRGHPNYIEICQKNPDKKYIFKATRGTSTTTNPNTSANTATAKPGSITATTTKPRSNTTRTTTQPSSNTTATESASNTTTAAAAAT
jgi:hypothetical protein